MTQSSWVHIFFCEHFFVLCESICTGLSLVSKPLDQLSIFFFSKMHLMNILTNDVEVITGYCHFYSRDNSRPKLRLDFRPCPRGFTFFKNLFCQKECKYITNIGIAQVRGALLEFFREVSFYTSTRCCLQFLK